MHLALGNIIVLIIAQSTIRDMKTGALSNLHPNGSAKRDSELFFFGAVIRTFTVTNLSLPSPPPYNERKM